MTSHVDYVVSSHSASDHMGGLAVVLAKLQVSARLPGCSSRGLEHSRQLRDLLMTLEPAALEKLALARGIPVYEPFAGASMGPFVVLSPGHDWFVDALLPSFVLRSRMTQCESPVRAGHREISRVRPLAGPLDAPGRTRTPASRRRHLCGERIQRGALR